jgi:hypothetical protein
MSPLCEAQKNATDPTDKSFTTSNNPMGLGSRVASNSLDKGLGSSSKDPLVEPLYPSIVEQEKVTSTVDGLGVLASAALGKISVETDSKISVETDQEGIIILDGGLIPYKKGALDLAHATKYWSYYPHIHPSMNHTAFPAVTADNMGDFLAMLCSIRQDVVNIWKISFEATVVAAFNQSGHTSRGQPLTSIADVEEVICNWKGSVLSCLQLNWRNNKGRGQTACTC